MGKKREAPIYRLTLELPEDVARALKARAALEGVAPRDLVVAWVRTWKEQR
jgi:hypothetical protein